VADCGRPTSSVNAMIRTGIGPQAIGRVALQRLSAACGIAVPVLSTIVLLTVNHLHPGYSLTRQRISELGALGAPYAALLNTAGLGASGLLLVALSLGLYLEFRNRSAARIGCALIGVSGIALVMAGIFPCSVGSAETSVSAIAHGVFARIGEFAIMSAALAMWLGLKGCAGWKGHSFLSLTVAVVAVALYVPYQFHFLAPWKGAIQRFLVLVFLIWIELMSIKLLSWSLAGTPDEGT